MGDNDVQNNYRTGVSVDKLMGRLFLRRRATLPYQHTARRVLLVNVPQLDRAPNHNLTIDTLAQNAMLKGATGEYNKALVAKSSDYKAARSDVKMEIYDFNTYMGQVMDNPGASGFRDAVCEGSGEGSKCVWWEVSSGHVTSRIHGLMTGDMGGTTKALGW